MVERDAVDLPQKPCEHIAAAFILLPHGFHIGCAVVQRLDRAGLRKDGQTGGRILVHLEHRQDQPLIGGNIA